jgi:hypothetical protein
MIAGFSLSQPLGPGITSQPADVTVWESQSAAFNITAVSSAGVLHYQWKFNGSNVGTDSATYTRSNCSVADSGGTVTCNVTDDNGTVASSNATLTVLYAPQLAWIRA